MASASTSVVSIESGNMDTEVLSAKPKNLKKTSKQSEATKGSKPDTSASAVSPRCVGCNGRITASTKAINCDRCRGEGQWKCISCLGISPEVYSVLTKCHNFKWFCNSCDEEWEKQPGVHSHGPGLTSDSVLVAISEMSDAVASLEARLVSKIEHDVSTAISAQFSAFEARLGAVTASPAPVPTPEQFPYLNAAMAPAQNDSLIGAVEKVTEQLREDKDLAARVSNAIFYRVPESDSSVFNTRISEDRTFIDNLCADALDTNLADNDVVNMYRLGRRPLDADWRSSHPRPLLVTFKDAHIKRRIMANAPRLKEATDQCADIGISNDLTPKQRAENKSLLDAERQKLIDAKQDPKNYKMFIVTRDNRRVVITKPL